MATTITSLTPSNIAALDEAQNTESLGIELTDKHGTRRGHPVQSLAAVRRKLETAVAHARKEFA